MNEQSVSNLYEALESAEFDPAVGIRLAHLTGNGGFSLYAAEIAPHKRVSAHFHNNGIETYQIIAGEGLMCLGKPRQDGNVGWLQPFKIKRGDCFTIGERTVHQLFNTSDEKLIAVFGCPQSHLSTDRTLMKSANGNEEIE